ncbi:MAG: sterol desaturase family protein [Cyclobacteriaceae bacterium]|nr:sterol desaturase family protein [Cyclobacteriaceae bacterium]
MEYINTFFNSIVGTANWVLKLILFEVPWYQNYFYGLIAISFFAWGLELLFPWRKNQSAFRKDFWLDGFYMFFNFFIFSIIINGVYGLIEKVSGNFGISMSTISLLDLSTLPTWSQLLLFFIVLDFVQWATHVILHKFPVLWRFHKVHHSVEQMGFAAHLRYHWMENIFYKPLKTLAIMLLGGFEPQQAYMVHFFAILIGHLNHSNVRITYGPLKYLLNNPIMHIWHHSYDLPKDHKLGINFGISLSIWDYLFKTNYIPHDGRDIRLGFPGIEKFPTTFITQNRYGFSSTLDDNPTEDTKK